LNLNASIVVMSASTWVLLPSLTGIISDLKGRWVTAVLSANLISQVMFSVLKEYSQPQVMSFFYFPSQDQMTWKMCQERASP